MFLSRCKIVLPMALLVVMASVISCTSDKNTAIELRLTDAPALYDAVNVDISQVQLHSDSEGWVDVPLVRPGVYNLLEFSNGLDTLLGKIELPAGNISQLRLVLGAKNTIVADGLESDLTIPSGSSSGLKFNLHQPLEAGVSYRLWIDFDAARSIVKTGNNKFRLKPVVRMFSEASTGAISGTVNPAEAKATVTATSVSDTLMALPLANGTFLIRGVPSGIYTVSFTPAEGSGFMLKEVTGVNVVVGKNTHLEPITLPIMK